MVDSTFIPSMIRWNQKLIERVGDDILMFQKGLKHEKWDPKKALQDNFHYLWKGCNHPCMMCPRGKTIDFQLGNFMGC